MITVLIKYRVTIQAAHPMLDDKEYVESKIVEVDKLTNLNNMYKKIVDVKILS